MQKGPATTVDDKEGIKGLPTPTGERLYRKGFGGKRPCEGIGGVGPLHHLQKKVKKT